MMRRPQPKVAFQGKAVTIACTDKARSLRFYREVLGAEPLPGDEGYGCPWLRLGALTFSLLPNASGPCPVKFPTDAGAMLWLEVDDLGAAHRHLVQNGVPVVDQHEGVCMYVTDPDGLLIEIWQSQPESERRPAEPGTPPDRPRE
jgi:catechol 2,3-dioxygenase-like lactoylglutathione lyase family enzyme